MAPLYLQALVTNAVSLLVLMSLAWVVRQRSVNAGLVDTIWLSCSAVSVQALGYGRQGHR